MSSLLGAVGSLIVGRINSNRMKERDDECRTLLVKLKAALFLSFVVAFNRQFACVYIDTVMHRMKHLNRQLT